jgi:acetyltransferase-like isoleucine patch superfamily enzyme
LIFPGTIVRGRRLSVGRGTTFNYRCVIECREQVTIGERCGIGIGVLILTSFHDVSDPRVRAGVGVRAPVRIGDGVAIASNTVVLPGVTIGDGVSTAAGAVILHDCEPHGLYAGVPAVRKRDLPAPVSIHQPGDRRERCAVRPAGNTRDGDDANLGRL